MSISEPTSIRLHHGGTLEQVQTASFDWSRLIWLSSTMHTSMSKTCNDFIQWKRLHFYNIVRMTHQHNHLQVLQNNYCKIAHGFLTPRSSTKSWHYWVPCKLLLFNNWTFSERNYAFTSVRSEDSRKIKWDAIQKNPNLLFLTLTKIQAGWNQSGR